MTGQEEKEMAITSRNELKVQDFINLIAAEYDEGDIDRGWAFHYIDIYAKINGKSEEWAERIYDLICG